MLLAKDIKQYNAAQPGHYREVCALLAAELSNNLPSTVTSKVWHGGPVWFDNGNPVVGYWVRKNGVQLLFWSGQSFDEPGLKPEGKFKAAVMMYQQPSDLNTDDLKRWLDTCMNVQWDYKNIVKRRGELVRLK
jgi:hypothetical protein